RCTIWARSATESEGASLRGANHILRDTGRYARLAEKEPSHGEGAVGRLLQEGLGPAEHHVARVGRRGVVLRMDRWGSQEHRRGELQDPVHASPCSQHL